MIPDIFPLSLEPLSIFFLSSYSSLLFSSLLFGSQFHLYPTSCLTLVLFSILLQPFFSFLPFPFSHSCFFSFLTSIFPILPLFFFNFSVLLCPQIPSHSFSPLLFYLGFSSLFSKFVVLPLLSSLSFSLYRFFYLFLSCPAFYSPLIFFHPLVHAISFPPLSLFLFSKLRTLIPSFFPSSLFLLLSPFHSLHPAPIFRSFLTPTTFLSLSLLSHPPSC